MPDRDTKKVDKRRKIAGGGAFLPGHDMYDDRGNLLPTGTVPAPQPKSQPAEGALTAAPEEQLAGAPEAPITPDPWGGTVSESHAHPYDETEQGGQEAQSGAAHRAKHPESHKDRIEQREAGHATPGQ